MNSYFLANLVNCVLQEIIEHEDQKCSKMSLILYSYFQMLYNIASLVNISLKPTGDRTIIPQWYQNLRSSIAYDRNKLPLLRTFIFYGHTGFLSKLYDDYDKDKISIKDIGDPVVCLNDDYINKLIEWGGDYITCKADEFKNTNDEIIESEYQPVDIDNTFDFIADNMEEWLPLIKPSGIYKCQEGFPSIDINIPQTYEKTPYESANWYKTRGFNIENTSIEIPKINWQNCLKEQTYLLLENFSKLEENKQLIQFFHFNKKSSGIVGLWFIIMSMFNTKYCQSIEQEIISYFVLSCGILDATITSWQYKNKINMPRTINIIRQFLKDEKLMCWNYKGQKHINGANWTPFQPIDKISPSSPDYASEITIISRVAKEIINWRFKSDRFYNGFNTINIVDPTFISDMLSIQHKTLCIGEFIIYGQVFRRYKTLNELYDDINKTCVVSGINWPLSIEKSDDIGVKIAKRVLEKIQNIYNIYSIC